MHAISDQSKLTANTLYFKKLSCDFDMRPHYPPEQCGHFIWPYVHPASFAEDKVIDMSNQTPSPKIGDWRVTLFLVGTRDFDALTERARRAAADLSARTSGTAHVVVPAIVPGALDYERNAVNSHADGRSHFDLAVEVIYPDKPRAEDIAVALAEFACDLSDLVSPAHCVAFVGRDVIFDARRGPLKFMFAMTKQPHLSQEEAMTGWQTEVGPNLASHPTRVGYIEQQGDMALCEVAIAATGYNGGAFNAIAIEWFRTPEDTVAANDWSTSYESVALASDPPQEGGIITLLSRYFDLLGASKILFGHEPDPTVQ